MSAYRKLTPQQRRFVDHIVRGLLGYEATLKVRPHLTYDSARELASRWRALPDVKAAIEERQEEAMEDAGITNAQILLGIAAAANLSIKQLVHLQGCQCSTPNPCAKLGEFKRPHELDDETARIIESVKFESGGVEYRVPKRLEARKLLGQYRKLFTQNMQLDGRLTLAELVGASMQGDAGEASE